MSPKKRVAIASGLFRKHGTTIWSMIKRYGLSEQDVDDVYQNIFLSITASPPSHGTSLPAYLKAVVRNHVRDFYRRAVSRRAFVKAYTGHLKSTAVGHSHETEFDDTEDVRKAMGLLGCALPPYMARVLNERYVHGKTVDEIAVELGIEKRSISRYCCVGLKRLRRLLGE